MRKQKINTSPDSSEGVEKILKDNIRYVIKEWNRQKHDADDEGNAKTRKELRKSLKVYVRECVDRDIDISEFEKAEHYIYNSKFGFNNLR